MLIAVLEAKAGAKIRHFFETTKSFGNFFQKTSKNLCFALPARVYLSDCGCKGSALFLFSKHFYNYFQKLFRFFNNIREFREIREFKEFREFSDC